MLGVRIPEFRILSRLRQGGTATVYVAERIDAPGRLALKLLHPEVSADTEGTAQEGTVIGGGSLVVHAPKK